MDKLDFLDNNNNNNNDRIERRISRFLIICSLCRKVSPTCTLKCPGHYYVQITCNTKLHATHRMLIARSMSCVTLYEGTPELLCLAEFRSINRGRKLLSTIKNIWVKQKEQILKRSSSVTFCHFMSYILHHSVILNKMKINQVSNCVAYSSSSLAIDSRAGKIFSLADATNPAFW